MKRNGIIVSGVATIDRIMAVDHYPREGGLIDIGEPAISTGGALCNVLLDIAKLDSSIPLHAVGVIGNDELGDRTFAALQHAKHADLSGVVRAGRACYTDVYESGESKQRTFFHQRGANRLLDVDHYDLEHSNAKILSVGYVMLLDTLDSPDEEYGTRMARLLGWAQSLGMETCIDVVSLKSAKFRRTAAPALQHATYCVINETEAQEITGIVLRNDAGALVEENVAPALQALRKEGVGKWAVDPHAEGILWHGSYGRDDPRAEPEAFPQLYQRHGWRRGRVLCGRALCCPRRRNAEKRAARGERGGLFVTAADGCDRGRTAAA